MVKQQLLDAMEPHKQQQYAQLAPAAKQQYIRQLYDKLLRGTPPAQQPARPASASYGAARPAAAQFQAEQRRKQAVQRKKPEPQVKGHIGGRVGGGGSAG